MGAPSSGVAPEIVAYVDAEVAKLKGARRCWASWAVAIVGTIVSLAGIAGYVSLELGAIGGAVAANGAVLIGLYCKT